MAKTKSPSTKKAMAYDIEVSGWYFKYTADHKSKELAPFTESFIIPETVEYANGREVIKTKVDGNLVTTNKPKIHKSNGARCAMHIIKKFHLMARLKANTEKYGLVTGVREFEITKKKKVEVDAALVARVADMKIDDMDESHLLQLMALKGFEVNLSLYSNLGAKRTKVAQAYKKFQDDNKAVKASTSDEDILMSDPDEEFELDSDME
jgi:hypothetical protein